MTSPKSLYFGSGLSGLGASQTKHDSPAVGDAFRYGTATKLRLQLTVAM